MLKGDLHNCLMTEAHDANLVMSAPASISMGSIVMLQITICSVFVKSSYDMYLFFFLLLFKAKNRKLW